MSRRRLAVLVSSVVFFACAREPRQYRYPPPNPWPAPGNYGHGKPPPPAAPPPAPPSPYGWPFGNIGWNHPLPLPSGWSMPQIPGFTPPAAAGQSGNSSGVAAGARYGSLSAAQCFLELGRRGISYRAVSQASGVEIPMRLAAPLGGVSIIMAGTNQIGTSSQQDILDCRLALALDDFAGVLSARGVVRVDHMSLYRSGAKVAGKGTPSQHAYGLAIDIGSLRRLDGQVFSVQRDWATARGSPPCPGPAFESGAPAFLRDVVCSSLREGVFNTYITPNHNAAHDNHFHFDLILGEPGVYAELL